METLAIPNISQTLLSTHEPIIETPENMIIESTSTLPIVDVMQADQCQLQAPIVDVMQTDQYQSQIPIEQDAIQIDQSTYEQIPQQTASIEYNIWAQKPVTEEERTKLKRKFSKFFF